VNVARNLRNCCVTSSTQLNIIQRDSTSAVHAAGIVQPSHTQDNRKSAAKQGIPALTLATPQMGDLAD